MSASVVVVGSAAEGAPANHCSSKRQQDAPHDPSLATSSTSTALSDEDSMPPYSGRLRRRGAVLETGDALMFPTSTDLVRPEHSNIPVNFVFPPDDDRDVQIAHRSNLGSPHSQRREPPGGAGGASTRGPQQGQQSLPAAPKLGGAAMSGRHQRVGWREADCAFSTPLAVRNSTSPNTTSPPDAFGDVVVPPLRQPDSIHASGAPKMASFVTAVAFPEEAEERSTSDLTRHPTAPQTSAMGSCPERHLTPQVPPPLDGSAVTKAASEIVCLRLQDDPDSVPSSSRMLDEALDPVAAGTPTGAADDAVGQYDASFHICLGFMAELSASKRLGVSTFTPAPARMPTNIATAAGGKQPPKRSINRKRTVQAPGDAQPPNAAARPVPDASPSASPAHMSLADESQLALLLHFFDPDKVHNTLVQQWQTNHYDPAPATPHHTEQQRGRCASVAMEAEWRALAVKVLLAKCPSLKRQTFARKKSLRQLSHDEMPPDETNEEQAQRLQREEALLALDRAFQTESMLLDEEGDAKGETAPAHSPLLTIGPESFLDPIRGLHVYLWPSYAKAQYLYRVTQRVSDALVLDTHIAGGVVRCPAMCFYDVAGFAVTVQPVPILAHGWKQNSLRVPLGGLRHGDMSLLSFACSQLLWHTSLPARLFDVYCPSQQELTLHRGQEGFLYILNPDGTQDRGSAVTQTAMLSKGSMSRKSSGKGFHKAGSSQVQEADNSPSPKKPQVTTNTRGPGGPSSGFAHLKRGALVSIQSESSLSTQQSRISSVLRALTVETVESVQRGVCTYVVGSVVLNAIVFSPKFAFRGLFDAFQLAYSPEGTAAVHPSPCSTPSARGGGIPSLGAEADLEAQATSFFRYVADVVVPRVTERLVVECAAARAAVEQHFIHRHGTPEDKEEQAVMDVVRLGVFAKVLHDGNLPVAAADLILRCVNTGQFGNDEHQPQPSSSSSAKEASTTPAASLRSAALAAAALAGGARRGSRASGSRSSSVSTKRDAAIGVGETVGTLVRRNQRKQLEVRETSDDERDEEDSLQSISASQTWSRQSADFSGGLPRNPSIGDIGQASSPTTTPSSARLKRVISAKIEEDVVTRRIALRVVKTEMLGRAAKSILRVQLATLGGPVSQHMHLQALNRLRRLMHETHTPDSEAFWKDVLLPVAKKKFHMTCTKDISFADRRQVPPAAVALRMFSCNPFHDEPPVAQLPCRLHRPVDVEKHLRGMQLLLHSHTTAIELRGEGKAPQLYVGTDHVATTGSKEGPTLVRYCTKDSTQPGGFFGLIRAPAVTAAFPVDAHIPYAMSLLGCSTTLPPRGRSGGAAHTTTNPRLEMLARQRVLLASLQRRGSVGRHAAWHSAYLFALRCGSAAALDTLEELFSADMELIENRIEALRSGAIDILEVANDISAVQPSRGGGGIPNMPVTVALTSSVQQRTKLGAADTSGMESNFRQKILKRVEDGTLFELDVEYTSPKQMYQQQSPSSTAGDAAAAMTDERQGTRDFLHDGVFGGKSSGQSVFSRSLGAITLLLMRYDADRLRRLALDLDVLRFGGVEVNFREQSTAIVLHIMLQITEAVATHGMVAYDEARAPPAPPPQAPSTNSHAPTGKKPKVPAGSPTRGDPKGKAHAKPAPNPPVEPTRAVDQPPASEALPPMKDGSDTPTVTATTVTSAAAAAATTAMGAKRHRDVKAIAAVADSPRDEDITKWALISFNLLVAEILTSPEEIVDHLPMSRGLVAIGDSLESRNVLQVTQFIRLLNDKFCATCRGASRQDLITRRGVALRALRSVTRQGKLITNPDVFDALVGLLDESVYRTYSSGVADYESDVSIQCLLMVVVLGCAKVHDAPRTACVRRLLHRLQSDNSRALASLQDQLQSKVMGSMYWLFRRNDSLDLLQKVLTFMEKKKVDLVVRTRLKAFLEFHAHQLVCTSLIQRIGQSYRIRKTLYPRYLDFDRKRTERAIAASIMSVQEAKILEHEQKLQREDIEGHEATGRAQRERHEGKQWAALLHDFVESRPKDMFYPLLSLNPTSRNDDIERVTNTVFGVEPHPPSKARGHATCTRRGMGGKMDDHTDDNPASSDDDDDGITPTPPQHSGGSMEDTWLDDPTPYMYGDSTKGNAATTQKRKRKLLPYGSSMSASQSGAATIRAPLYASTKNNKNRGSHAQGTLLSNASFARAAPKVPIDERSLLREEDDLSELLWSIFAFCDADKDGYITADEVILATSRMELRYFVEELRGIFGVKERRFVKHKGVRMTFTGFQDAVMRGCGLL